MPANRINNRKQAYIEFEKAMKRVNMCPKSNHLQYLFPATGVDDDIYDKMVYAISLESDRSRLLSFQGASTVQNNYFFFNLNLENAAALNPGDFVLQSYMIADFIMDVQKGRLDIYA